MIEYSGRVPVIFESKITEYFIFKTSIRVTLNKKYADLGLSGETGLTRGIKGLSRGGSPFYLFRPPEPFAVLTGINECRSKLLFILHIGSNR